jgi:hypothetical protein
MATGKNPAGLCRAGGVDFQVMLLVRRLFVAGCWLCVVGRRLVFSNPQPATHHSQLQQGHQDLFDSSIRFHPSTVLAVSSRFTFSRFTRATDWKETAFGKSGQVVDR